MPIFGDAIPNCLVESTIQKFDATLHRTLIEKYVKWIQSPGVNGPWMLQMQMGEYDLYSIMKRACAGSTVLIAVTVSGLLLSGTLKDVSLPLLQ